MSKSYERAQDHVYERDIEKYLGQKVKEWNGEIRKVKWIGRRGAPDRRVMVGRCAWVEVKAPGVQLEAHQAREHQRMIDNGETVTTVASFFGVNQLMIDLLNRRHIQRRYE